MTELFGVADGVLPSVLLLEPGVDTDPCPAYMFVAEVHLK